jgi:polyisoprenoid-binding protein YceI
VAVTAIARAALCAVVLSLGARAAVAQGALPPGTVREGTLSFDGRATVGNFTGTTTAVTGEMSGGDSLPAVRGWVEAPVRTLKTGNGRRDRDLNRSMESDKYPTIRFELTGVEPLAPAGDSLSVRLFGRFIIHGVTREATIPVRVVVLPEAIRVRGETLLNLEDYGIGSLTKMMGMLKMHEEIVVHIDLTFAASAPAGQALR